MTSNQKKGLLILRYGLALLYLWFGFSQLFDGVDWVSWVPLWATALIHLPPAMIVLFNGIFEVIMGMLLAMGIFVRPVALLLTIHLAIVTLDIGFTAIGMRDLGLTLSTLALGLLSEPEITPSPTAQN